MVAVKKEGRFPDVGGANWFQDVVKLLQVGCLDVPLQYEDLPNSDWVVTGMKSREHEGRCMSTTAAVRWSFHMGSL